MNREITKEDVVTIKTDSKHECNAWCKPPRHCDTLATGNGVTFEIFESLCRDWCNYFDCQFVSVEPATEAPLVMTEMGIADHMWLMTWIDNNE